MGPLARSELCRRFTQAEQSLGWDSLVARFITGRQIGFLWLISSPGQTHASVYSFKLLHASGWRRLNSEDAPEQWQVKSYIDQVQPGHFGSRGQRLLGIQPVFTPWTPQRGRRVPSIPDRAGGAGRGSGRDSEWGNTHCKTPHFPVKSFWNMS